MSPVRDADVQPSNIAGTWYPGDAESLDCTVRELLAPASPPAGDPRAIVVPHAGYAYSGRAAGSGYAHVRPGRWRRAVVVAPSHYHAFAGGAVHPGRGFATPLGVVAIDRAAADLLLAHTGFFADAAPYDREHSLEIQLPFLQTVDPELPIVPVLVGADVGGAAGLAAGLRALDDGASLFVVSSDFTHYGAAFDYLPFPPSGADEVSRKLRELDLGAIERVCAGDASGFESYVAETGITVCGRAPISAFLHAYGAELRGETVCYYTSLDVTGDFEHSVSYAAIRFRGTEPSPGATLTRPSGTLSQDGRGESEAVTARHPRPRKQTLGRA
ncbi:MAG: hypothetical protein QOD06_3221 [Candidatus Binatota bacterium]|nr:hypothetical protein [Candidatus Binatota bacterium]